MTQISECLHVMYIGRGVIVDDSDNVLLGRRTKNGKLEVLGGKQDLGETIPQTIIREAREEGGVDIELLGNLLLVDCAVLHPRRGSAHHGFKVVVASLACISGGELTPQASEVSELLWTPRGELTSLQHEMTPTTLCALGAFGMLESDLLADAVVREFAKPAAA